MEADCCSAHHRPHSTLHFLTRYCDCDCCSFSALRGATPATPLMPLSGTFNRNKTSNSLGCSFRLMMKVQLSPCHQLQDRVHAPGGGALRGAVLPRQQQRGGGAALRLHHPPAQPRPAPAPAPGLQGGKHHPHLLPGTDSKHSLSEIQIQKRVKTIVLIAI